MTDPRIEIVARALLADEQRLSEEDFGLTWETIAESGREEYRQRASPFVAALDAYEEEQERRGDELVARVAESEEKLRRTCQNYLMERAERRACPSPGFALEEPAEGLRSD
jgi:hypothetical protein